MAMVSVSASRQAEGWGEGADGSPGLAASAGASAGGEPLSVAGASVGRGLGNGTAARCSVPRSRGGPSPNRSPHGAGRVPLAAIAGPDDAPRRATATTVTIAAAVRPKAP